MESIKTDICVIGAGAAGLSVASSAALLGVPVVLIEKGAMGGECLNTGCVPSKALIAAAARIAAASGRARFGIHMPAPHIDGPAVMARVRQVIADIAPVDSVERYRALGVRVVQAEARFADAHTVVAGDTRITARRFVIATGSQPVVLDIPGLADIPVLTSDSIFASEDLPTRLGIVGGGAIGCELAQAFRRLGSEVTLIEATKLLANEDPEAVAVVRKRLLREGVTIHEGTHIVRALGLTSGMTLDLDGIDGPAMLNEGQLLIAAGRIPRVEGLGLDVAGVKYGQKGIPVDDRQRTSNRRIFAIGDCAEGPHLTHAASTQAQIVIRNAVFRQRARFDPTLIPRVTYTDPEIASVGLSEIEARRRGVAVQTLRFPFSEVDRARTDDATDGFVKVVTGRRDRILGVTIVGAHAGELIAPWILAMQNGLPVTAMAGLIAPYPTLTEASRRAAVQALTSKLRSPWVARLIHMARMLG